MSSTVFVFLGLVALSQAGILAPATFYAPQPAHSAWAQPAHSAWAQPQATIIKKVVAAEEPANYQFQYDINDHHTGDSHSQQERAENGAVKGSYELNDADGFRRIVEYTADDHHGFQANVRREPLQVIKKIVQAAPAQWQAPAKSQWQAPARSQWQAAPAHNPWQ